MLHGLDLLIVFAAGVVFGVIIVRYGIGVGSKIQRRAMDGMALDEDTKQIEQEYTNG